MAYFPGKINLSSLTTKPLFTDFLYYILYLREFTLRLVWVEMEMAIHGSDFLGVGFASLYVMVDLIRIYFVNLISRFVDELLCWRGMMSDVIVM